MVENKLNLVYASSIDQLVEANASFDKGVMRVAYHGKNANKTCISKEAFEVSIGSIYNCPVVCNYQVREDFIGGHDMELVNQGDGNYKLINCTHPVGVVPESARTYWEFVTEDDGSENEYLCTDVLLWKRQSAYEHIKDNGVTSESMEIKVLDGERKDDGYYHISKFEFTAFCLLERDKPCFESAGIELFSRDEFVRECDEMFEDLKREFSMVNTATAVDDTIKNSLEGGDKPLNIEELMSKYGLLEQDIDFDYSAMELSEVEERFAQIRENKIADEPVNEPQSVEFSNEPEAEPAAEPIEEPIEVPVVGDEEKFSLTAQQMVQEVYAALSAETVYNEYYGAVPRYFYVDYDANAGMVYAIDSIDNRMYGFNFSMDGDNVVIDFSSKKRMKIAFVEFDDGSASEEFNDYELMFSGLNNAINEKFAKMSEEIEELAKFKSDKLAAERKAGIAEVFAKFDDLDGNEVFAALQAECETNEELSVEAIEEKCYAIRGRFTDPTVKFSSTEGESLRLPIDGMSAKNNEPYNGIFLEFGIGQR